MQGNINPRIVGATVIGFAMVAGTYLVTNFNKPDITQTAQVVAAKPAPRVSIEVVDNDNNGIEDWRDDFITTEPVILDRATSTYTPPDTLTGELGINFMQNIILARGYAPFGRTDDEVISDTVDVLSKETAHDLYDTPDIVILENWTNEDIANYANAAADTITRNNIPYMDGELLILKDILDSGDQSRVTELESLAEVYRKNRDETLEIPVPAFLVKEHLDLINTYHAIHKDIDAMTDALDDPAFTLLRLKRYEDDAAGLGYALQNLYLSLEPHADLFTVDDPAAMFVIFSPDFQI